MEGEPRVGYSGVITVQKASQQNQLRDVEADFKKLVLKPESGEDRQTAGTASNPNTPGSASKKRSSRKKKISTSSCNENQTNDNGLPHVKNEEKALAEEPGPSKQVLKQFKNDVSKIEEKSQVVYSGVITVQKASQRNQLRDVEADFKKLVLKPESGEDRQTAGTASNPNTPGSASKKRRSRKKKTSTSSCNENQTNDNGLPHVKNEEKALAEEPGPSKQVLKQFKKDVSKIKEKSPFSGGGSSAVHKGDENPSRNTWERGTEKPEQSDSAGTTPQKPKKQELRTPKTPGKEKSGTASETKSVQPSAILQRSPAVGKSTPKSIPTVVFERRVTEAVTNITNVVESENGQSQIRCVAEMGAVNTKTDMTCAGEEKLTVVQPDIEARVHVQVEKQARTPKTDREVQAKRQEKRTEADATDDPIVIDATPEELKRLQQEHIVPLKQRNPRFRFAKYRCQACIYHMDNVPAADFHIKSDRHQTAIIAEMNRTTLRNLPAPTVAQLSSVNRLLESIVKENGMLSEDTEVRAGCVEALGDYCSAILPQCRFRAFGSSVTCLGFKDSDLNIGLWIEPPAKPVETLMMLLHLLRNLCDVYDEVQDEFASRIPSIKFLDIESGIQCRIVLEPENSAKCSDFLSQFVSMDDRFRKLTVCFKYWAKQCKLDDPIAGTLPPHAYSILTLYYLQQQDILPVLHKNVPKLKESAPGQGLSKPDKEEEDEKDELLDEEEEEKDIDETPEEGLDERPDEEDDGLYMTADEYLGKGGSVMKPKLTLAELWYGLLRFYSVDFAYNEKIVCVRQKEICTRAERNWGSKKMAIEDPFNRKQNMAACVSNTAVHDYILDCLRNTYSYFATPQLLDGPMFKGLCISPKFLQGSRPDKTAVDPSLALSWLTLWNNAPVLSVSEAVERATMLSARDLLYTFDVLPFTRGKPVPVMCSVCMLEGHLMANCPDLQLPKLQPLPPMRPQFMEWLDHMSWNILRRFIPTPDHLKERQRFITSLETYTKRIYPDARLEPFGSSCNGFGFVDSDLDLCLTFDSKPTGEGIDMKSVVGKLGQHLRRLPDLHSVLPIPSAKVPIVKMVHRHTNLSSDISLYNRLGQHNSHLLRAYAEIDARVRVLGFLIKLLAKECGVCEAARGSLSSYAYVLMLIHFLQQRDPPVLPVLQELYDPSQPAPQRLCDGWNTWFFEDIRNLHNVWPYCQANKESVAGLFLGFLRYYTESFDFSQRVVCIRQHRPLTRLQKMWTERPLAIEDPFDLSHNLGSGVSPKMGVYIIKMLCGARRIFGTPIIKLPPGFRSLEQYLFCPRLLTEAPPPNDRGCIICGKIGHKVRDCPVKQRSKAQKQVQRNWRERERNDAADGRKGPKTRGNGGAPNNGGRNDKGNGNF